MKLIPSLRNMAALTAALTALATGTAPAQTPPPAPAAKDQTAPTQIVFVPKKMLEENKTAGKLKENTFYWSNIPDDAAQGPKVSDEKGTPFLLLKGCGTEKTTKALSQVTLIRAYNVPAGARSAKITAELKTSYDEWIDQNPGEKTNPSLTYSFFKGAVEARKGSRISLPNENGTEWKVVETTTTVPRGAQQLVLVAKADFPTSISIASLDVRFTGQPEGTPTTPTPAKP